MCSVAVIFNNDFPFSGSPMIIDLDGDHDLEILVGSGSNLFVLDIKEKGFSQGYWNQFMGGYERRGSNSMAGCMISSFCNYNSMAIWDDGSCSMGIFDCDDGTSGCDCAGTCNGLSVNDCNGICNGDSLIDECGVCDGNGIDCDDGSFSNAECENNLGDMNIDGLWNVIDVIALVNCILLNNC